MADVFSKKKRSEVMSRIRSRGNAATELALAKLFRRNKITGWRRHFEIRGRAALPRRQSPATEHRRPTNFRVRPDFVFRRARLAVFVDGCFWHGCPRHATNPKNNRTFWRRKFSRNKKRDALVTRALRRAGWRVVRIWECALKKHPLNCVKRIQRAGK
ncbi:MAG TPA: very short patch repair endonuclease [Verrucomicrobiae bacterium]